MKVENVRGSNDVDISSVTEDSRRVREGAAFFAIPGESVDGTMFIEDALNKGAKAVVSGVDASTGDDKGATFITVDDPRDALAFCSARLYGSPSTRMCVIGITGTNGKTTTSYVIRNILRTWGKKVGLIGTIQYLIDDEATQALFTTPEAPEYQRLLRLMLDRGCEYVVSEVSSHALAQKRVDYTRYMRAVFTNLTRDHLDFHKTIENYLLAKKRLFTDLLAEDGVAIVNADDPVSPELVQDSRGQVITYGINAECDVTAKDISQDFDGTKLTIGFNGKEYVVTTGMIGIPNVYNILAAVSVAASLEIPADIIIHGVSNVPPVNGRFETLRSRTGVLFIVDYAHTPDALRNLLQTVREMPHQRIITLFGCGGNRDRGKRPIMGQIASELSDLVILTSDNPRHEDPQGIIEEIKTGIESADYISITERPDAVREAVKLSEEGDIVVVAGKGHETYQDIKGARLHMDDRELINEALRDLGRS